jgi:hypothetical protein
MGIQIFQQQKGVLASDDMKRTALLSRAYPLAKNRHASLRIVINTLEINQERPDYTGCAGSIQFPGISLTESGLSYTLFIRARHCMNKSRRGSHKIKTGFDDSGLTILFSHVKRNPISHNPTHYSDCT